MWRCEGDGRGGENKLSGKSRCFVFIHIIFWPFIISSACVMYYWVSQKIFLVPLAFDNHKESTSNTRQYVNVSDVTHLRYLYHHPLVPYCRRLSGPPSTADWNEQLGWGVRQGVEILVFEKDGFRSSPPVTDSRVHGRNRHTRTWFCPSW